MEMFSMSVLLCVHLKKERYMNLNEVRSLAKEYGIRTSRLSKEQLIKAIQVEEGNFDCFATAVNGYCDQTGCKWREDCLTLSQKKLDA